MEVGNRAMPALMTVLALHWIFCPQIILLAIYWIYLITCGSYFARYWQKCFNDWTGKENILWNVLLNCALVPFWNMKYSASSDCYWICDGRWCRWQSRGGPCYHILAPVRSSCHLAASSRNNFRQQLFGQIRFLHILSCSPCNPNIVFINWT